MSYFISRCFVIVAALVFTGCYGPSHMINHRSPDNWSRVPKGFKCDAYSCVADTVDCVVLP